MTFDRAHALARLGRDEFDVIVVGGGITGAGVALDAAARGLRTALVERRDWASGTSSKSSKMVHGGLRYLQQKEYFLVYENLAERQRLLHNAPHLVRPLPFLIPLFGKDGVLNRTMAKAYSTALWLYDLTGGIRIRKRHRKLDKDEVLAHLPTLNTDLLVAGFLYYDAKADDARLTLTIARTAVLDHGAVAANYSPVVALEKDGAGCVSGVGLEDGTVVRGRCVVNAGGVWADDLRQMDEVGDVDTIRPAKGIHITVPRAKLPCDIAAVIPVLKDRRSIFVVPWGEHCYLGTTDTDYTGSLDEPRCTADDVRYVLDAVNTFFREPLAATDVVATWAGLRPLVKGASTERTADLSRRHAVLTSASGLVTVTGGKLTTYRKMAEDTVDAAVAVLRAGNGSVPRSARRCPTARLVLRGGDGDAVDDDDHLGRRYGSEARVVRAIIEADPSTGEPLVPGLPYLRAEALYAVRYEMARTVEDVLSRRTRALLLDRDACDAAAPEVAALIGPTLAWSEADIDREVTAFRDLVAAERDAVGAAERDAVGAAERDAAGAAERDAAGAPEMERADG